MRHFVLALMIALLPLRGWVGDAMAMELWAATPGQPASAIDSVAHHGHSSRAEAGLHAEEAMHADCPDHAASDDDNAPATADCGTCSACQICHTIALTPAFPQLASASLPAARPHVATHRFASAERAPGFKPPIL